MEPVGATILHELMHFPKLFVDVKDYHAYIPSGDSGDYTISDLEFDQDGKTYKAYGPYATTLLSKRGIDPTMGTSQAIKNADSYVWYAISRYWHWKCGSK